MIINNVLQCRGFTICYGHMDSGETLVVDNNQTGLYNQLVYILEGSAQVQAGSNITPLLEHRVYDLAEFRNQKLTYSTDTGVSWRAINPVPWDKQYDWEQIGPDTERSLTGNGDELHAIVLAGTVTVNGSILEPGKYARILQDRTANISTGPAGQVLVLRNVK